MLFFLLSLKFIWLQFWRYPIKICTIFTVICKKEYLPRTLRVMNHRWRTYPWPNPVGWMLSLYFFCTVCKKNLDYRRYQAKLSSWIHYFSPYLENKLHHYQTLLRGIFLVISYKTYIHYSTTHNSQDAATTLVFNIRCGQKEHSVRLSALL